MQHGLAPVPKFVRQIQEQLDLRIAELLRRAAQRRILVVSDRGLIGPAVWRRAEPHYVVADASRLQRLTVGQIRPTPHPLF